MEGVGRLWLDRGFLSSEAGAAALRRCLRLSSAQYEVILGWGDALARRSIRAAQGFYCAAPEMALHLGSAFSCWVAIGQSLVGAGGPGGELALAYFSVGAERAARVGLGVLREWAELLERLAGKSERLGASLAQATASVLGRVAWPKIRAWAEAAIALRERYGWRGELLADLYLAAGRRALELLDAADFASWAELGVVLRQAGWGGDLYIALPASVRGWGVAERAAYLRISLALARRDAEAGREFYLGCPAALASFAAALRARLLAACEAIAADPDAVPELLGGIPLLGACIGSIPEAEREAALDLLVEVAREAPAAAVQMLRVLPAVFERAALDGVRAWVQRGLEIGARDARTARAYFGLESRTSWRVLSGAATGVALEDVGGVLGKFVSMLSGQPARLVASAGLHFSLPMEEGAGRPEGGEISLPGRIDCFPSEEENFRFYKVLAAMAAGRREFGTYEVPRDAIADPALSALFCLTDGYRVARRLMRAYPGLAPDFAWVAERLVRAWGADESGRRFLDALLLAALLPPGMQSSVPARVAKAAAAVSPCLAPLGSPEATAYDALRVAEQLWALVGGARRERGGATSCSGLDGAVRVGRAAPPLSGELEAFAAQREAAIAEHMTNPALSVRQEWGGETGGTLPITAEELMRVLEAGAELRLGPGEDNGGEGVAVYACDLSGGIARDPVEEGKQRRRVESGVGVPAGRSWRAGREEGPTFQYDEWDYHLGDYRPAWCRLTEVAVRGDTGEFFRDTLAAYAALVPELRRQFQRIRAAGFRLVRGFEDGEEVDLHAAVDARAQVRARRAPSPKLYLARKREVRDVAALFLVDMSASTDERVLGAPAPQRASREDLRAVPAGRSAVREQRIIDVLKEALVVLAVALEGVGDAYAIYGFSGHGRENVEVYPIKSFAEALGPAVQSRLGGIEPKRSTRMGAALRHAVQKMVGLSSAAKYLFLLSDGFPQDFDYGEDRRSNAYGIRDTAMALREAEAAGILPFCITVDKAGHDYLRDMCEASRYLVIEDVFSLPRVLPRIYQNVVGTN